MINIKKVIELSDDDGIIKYSLQILDNYNLPEQTKLILNKIGVPKYAAPYISFIEENNGGGMKLIEYYDLAVYEDSEYINKEELEEIKGYFKKYVVLGNIENDVFVLNEKFRVIRIDSETLDEYYINYNLDDFLESLYIYKKIIDNILGRYDELVFYDEKITEEDIQLLKNKLLKIDKNSLIKDSFWSNEIERLNENIN